MEVILIAGVLLGIIIGTAFIYDLFYGRIPNVLIMVGFLFWFPYIVFTRGISEVMGVVISVVLIGGILFFIYAIGGIGAGDVKLISLIVAFLSLWEGLKLVALIFVAGAFAGIFKMFMLAISWSSDIKKPAEKIRIRFSGPILVGYLLMLLSKGGI